MHRKAKKGTKTSPVSNSSSRAIFSSGSEIHQVSQSPRPTWSRQAGCCSLDTSDRSYQPPTRTVRVLDNAGKDATPLPLYHAEPGEMLSEPGRLFLGEVFPSSGSDHSGSPSSINMCTSSSFIGGSRLSSLSCKASLTSETKAYLIPKQTPAPCEVPRKIDTVEQHVTEEILDEVVEICLTETDTISLLDIPSTLVSEDADDAEAIKEKNIYYAELCKRRLGNDKYVARAMQTFNGAPKDKLIQCDNIVMVDKGTVATVWDIYDSFCSQNERPASVKVSYPLPSTVDTSKGQEKRGEKSSGCSSISTGSIISSFFNNVSAEPDPQQILLSESFQYSLLIMERNIVANIFQPKLTAYRGLPILEDPDSMAKPENEERSKEDEESSLTPKLEPLWAFSCEITKGCNITSMAWNKKNLDLLAVGYGDLDSRNQNPGFICCWSLKNPTWPERVFRCHSCVTSLDFSANNPSQLAVGMFDGTVAIYNVQFQDNGACMVNSSKCLEKHLYPVWQVTWTKQEIGLAGEERAESLVSVSADGRITSWLLSNNGLDSIDLMKLGSLENIEKEDAVKKKMTNDVLSAMTSGLSINFHPTNYGIYLVGTGDGPILMCSISNRENFLDTYQTHISAVNHIEWSPFSPELFLSCSSDWTIQLWKQGDFAPLLSFSTDQRAVYTAKWSPNWPTVFGAINGQQLEIWNLNSNILSPTILHYSAPGVKMRDLLFAKGTNCVLVGDSDGQVTVYKLKNLNVGEGKQVDNLEDIINSRLSR